MGLIRDSVTRAGRATLLACVLLGCGGAPRTPAPSTGGRAPRPDELPAVVRVPAANVAVGFFRSARRTQAQVDAFGITKSPVTVGQYRACVEAGACVGEPRHTPSCGARGASIQPGEQGGGDLPMTCVEPASASTYCAWIGGSLPALEQWLLAARGPAPARYALGAQAPEARQPSGLLDVLTTPAELLRGSAESGSGACGAAAPFCAVSGHDPGAMDFAFTISPSAPGDERAFDDSLTYGFRCVEVLP